MITQVTIAEGENAALAQYLEVTSRLFDEVGAKVVQRFNLTDVVPGHRPAKSIIIVAFPCRDAVELVFSSQSYQELIPVRDRAFEIYSVTIADHDSSAPSR